MLDIVVGDTVHIENASVKQFKGAKHLSVDRRRGTISVVTSDAAHK